MQIGKEDQNEVAPNVPLFFDPDELSVVQNLEVNTMVQRVSGEMLYIWVEYQERKLLKE